MIKKTMSDIWHETCFQDFPDLPLGDDTSDEDSDDGAGIVMQGGGAKTFKLEVMD